MTRLKEKNKLTRKIPDGWEATEKTIHRTFSTQTFQRGLDFVTQIGKLAERAKHHPDIILTYPTVIVTLMTHEQMRVTDKDLQMAQQINKLWGKFG